MTIDPAEMWAYATAPIADRCTATLRPMQRADRTLRRCALSAGHYDDQSWHTDDPDRDRRDGMTWADSARGAVPHDAPDHLRHAVENDTEDAPLLAVLAAADREAPRVRRVPGAAMVEGRFEVPKSKGPTTRQALSWELYDDSEPIVYERKSGSSSDRQLKIGRETPGPYDVPWLIVEVETGRQLGLVWAAPRALVETGDDRYVAVQLRPGAGTSSLAYVKPDAIEEAKRRTRRDVASVIT